jgi:undecaprenyl-diphosphatase
LVFLWFATRDRINREKNQQAILITLMGIGITNVLVALCNQFYFRVRPFNELPASSVNLLFYRPHDSSFPSNFTAALFAIGVAIYFKNKKCGIALLVISFLGGFARIFVGIHYPLDILGGAAIGVFGSFLAYEISKLIAPGISGLLNLLRKIYLA